MCDVLVEDWKGFKIIPTLSVTKDGVQMDKMSTWSTKILWEKTINEGWFHSTVQIALMDLASNGIQWLECHWQQNGICDIHFVLIQLDHAQHLKIWGEKLRFLEVNVHIKMILHTRHLQGVNWIGKFLEA